VVDLLTNKHCPPEGVLAVFDALQDQNEELRAKLRIKYAHTIPNVAMRVSNDVCSRIQLVIIHKGLPRNYVTVTRGGGGGSQTTL
jgi:hypothetical protein